MCVAGGFVIHHLVQKATQIVDIDIFLIAPTATAALNLALTAIHHMETQCNMTCNSVALSMTALTLYTTTHTGTKLAIQFILNPYPSIGAVLRSFDLSPCALAWTGFKVVCTPAAGLWLDTGKRTAHIAAAHNAFTPRETPPTETARQTHAPPPAPPKPCVAVDEHAPLGPALHMKPPCR
jgi:hypothetical protein